MRTVTIFCVQTYVSYEGRVEFGPVRHFTSCSEAELVFAVMVPRVDGVALYEVTGEPEFDVWGEPILLQHEGTVPREVSAARSVA